MTCRVPWMTTLTSFRRHENDGRTCLSMKTPNDSYMLAVWDAMPFHSYIGWLV